MFCVECGAELPSAARYCAACGKQVVAKPSGTRIQSRPRSEPKDSEPKRSLLRLVALTLVVLGVLCVPAVLDELRSRRARQQFASRTVELDRQGRLNRFGYVPPKDWNRRDPKSSLEQVVKALTSDKFLGPTEKVTYDVRSTDSLVSPFVGSISYQEMGGFRRTKIVLAWQDECWIFKSGASRLSSGDWEGLKKPPPKIERALEAVYGD